FNSMHKINLSYRFQTAGSSTDLARRPSPGNPASADYLLSVPLEKSGQRQLSTFERLDKMAREEQARKRNEQEKPDLGVTPHRIVFKIDEYKSYEIQPGETLESISTRMYGDKQYVSAILAANRHLYSKAEEMTSGRWILLPIPATDLGGN